MKTNLTSNIVLQYYGNGYAVGIYGANREAVQTIANQLYNWGATESEPHFECDTFAYVLSDAERMTNFLANKIRLRAIRNGGLNHHLADRLFEKFQQLATLQLASVKWENFLPENVFNSESFFRLGNADYSTPNDDKADLHFIKPAEGTVKEEKIEE